MSGIAQRGYPNSVRAKAAIARTLNGDSHLFRFRRDDADTSATDIKLHDAIDQREESVVAAYADVAARVELCAALADDDATGADGLTAVRFDAQPLRIRVSSVARGTLTFLMSHVETPRSGS
jgi:hypothetical protein